MTGLQFVAAIVRSLAWPAAVVLAVALVRRELPGLFGRLESLEFRGAKASFARLADYETVAAVAAREVGSADQVAEKAAIRYEASEFGLVQALASVAPDQAVIDAWGLLEYQLNVASDRLAPDQPHGWPQVVRNLESWDKWSALYPVVMELRRLRDYTVRSSRPPSSADAARYVSVAQDLATTVRTAFTSCDVTDGRGAR